jgi:DNA-binding CsgD family transcriptional regulator
VPSGARRREHRKARTSGFVGTEVCVLAGNVGNIPFTTIVMNVAEGTCQPRTVWPYSPDVRSASPQVAIAVFQLSKASRLQGMTEPEHEVLGLVASGRNNAAIARDLVLSERAVEKHINSIFRKLGLRREPAGGGGPLLPAAEPLDRAIPSSWRLASPSGCVDCSPAAVSAPRSRYPFWTERPLRLAGTSVWCRHGGAGTT